MEGLIPLSRMVAGGRVFGEEGKGLPLMPLSFAITDLEMFPRMMTAEEAEYHSVKHISKTPQDNPGYQNRRKSV